MSEQNKMVVRRAVEEVWNRGNYAIIEEFVASDFVIHSSTPGEEVHGPEGVRQFYTMLRSAFPDIHFTIEDQIAEGDRVVTYWSARGTHTGEYRGFPPTGKQIKIKGIDIDRIVGGKAVECWPNVDELSMLQQLGVISMPGQTDEKTE